MATITFEKHLLKAIDHAVRSLPPLDITKTDLTAFRRGYEGLSSEQHEALLTIGRVCRLLLRQNGYVHLRGLELMPDVRGVVAIGDQLGELFADLSQQSTIVVEASPTIGSGLQGNQTAELFLHTDFAMLERPPAVTIIHCRQADPMGSDFGRSGISVVQHIVSKFFGAKMLEAFFNVQLPFGGRTPSGEDVLLHSPILTRPEPLSQDLTNVRFHPSRIHHGFRVLGRDASSDETEVLRLFLEAAAAVRFELHLEPGDYLLVNNRVALHDRTRCSLEIGRDGIKSRISHIAFVQEISPDLGPK